MNLEESIKNQKVDNVEDPGRPRSSPSSPRMTSRSMEAVATTPSKNVQMAVSMGSKMDYSVYYLNDTIGKVVVVIIEAKIQKHNAMAQVMWCNDYHLILPLQSIIHCF